MPPLSKSTSHTQAGLSLVEVLVSIVVISFGLLGVASLQITGLKNNHSALYRTTATVLAHDMLDRMRANKSAMIAGSYDTGGSFKGGSDAPSTPSTMVQRDMKDWLTTIDKRLPSGKGKIEATAGSSVLRITIQWDDQRGTGGSTNSMSIETQGCASGETCYF